MADDIVLNTGSGGSTLATDQAAGGEHYQQVKLVDGTADSTTAIESGGGVEAGALRVTMASDSTGLLSVTEPNKVSTDNSTTSTLSGGAVYTGTGEDVSQYAAITIQLDASHNSATDGMTFEFSTDNSNWDAAYLFTYTATNARQFQFAVQAQFFRIVYTNGGTIQTHFRVQTILHTHNSLTTIHRLADDVIPDRSALINKSVIIAQAAGSGDFVAIQSTAAGNLKVSVQEISDGLDIGAGNAGAETQRVSIATDDVNLSSISAKLAPNTTNGHSTYLNQDTSIIATIKGSAGTIYWLSVQSIDVTAVYLNLYDSTSATLGSTTPTNQFIVPTQGDAKGAGLMINFGPLGIQYSTGIQVAAAVEFDGTTDPGLNVVITNIGFE